MNFKFKEEWIGFGIAAWRAQRAVSILAVELPPILAESGSKVSGGKSQLIMLQGLEVRTFFFFDIKVILQTQSKRKLKNNWPTEQCTVTWLTNSILLLHFLIILIFQDSSRIIWNKLKQ